MPALRSQDNGRTRPKSSFFGFGLLLLSCCHLLLQLRRLLLQRLARLQNLRCKFPASKIVGTFFDDHFFSSWPNSHFWLLSWAVSNFCTWCLWASSSHPTSLHRFLEHFFKIESTSSFALFSEFLPTYKLWLFSGTPKILKSKMKKCKVNVKEMKKREFKFLESVESYIDWISVSGSHGGGSFLLGLPLLLILWLGAIWSLRVHISFLLLLLLPLLLLLLFLLACSLRRLFLRVLWKVTFFGGTDMRVISGTGSIISRRRFYLARRALGDYRWSGELNFSLVGLSELCLLRSSFGILFDNCSSVVKRAKLLLGGGPLLLVWRSAPALLCWPLGANSWRSLIFLKLRS